MMCMDCGSKMRRTTEPITEIYKGCSLTVSGIEHYVCDACGEYEIGAKEAESLSRALLSEYAKARDLLTPSEIRGIRKRLGLKQVEFERLLGVSTPAASRWETGAAAPSRSVCKLMRMYDAHPELLDEFPRANEATPTPMATGAHVTWKVVDGGKTHGAGEARYSVADSKKHVHPQMFEAKEG